MTSRKNLGFILAFIVVGIFVPSSLLGYRILRRQAAEYSGRVTLDDRAATLDLFRPLRPIAGADEDIVFEPASSEENLLIVRDIAPANIIENYNVKTENYNVKTDLKLQAKSEVTDWKAHFDSEACQRHKKQPPGRGDESKVGTGIRSLCYTGEGERSTKEYKEEIYGSLDVSISHRAIYIPVMKGASQLFQLVFKRRLKGKRIVDKTLLLYLKSHGLTLQDMFIFTFVRNPFKIFHSGYQEVNKYAERNRTKKATFHLKENRIENEPARALEALHEVQNGVFGGLIPAHMYSQLWKISRCTGREKTPLDYSFIGRIENLDEDWKYVESRLNITHEELPVYHSSSNLPKSPKVAKLSYDPVSKAPISKWAELTKQVCSYYQSDFDCFGYDQSLCST